MWLVAKLMLKSLSINLQPLTKKKRNILDSVFAEYLRVLNCTLAKLPEAKSSVELHHLTYSDIKKTSFLLADTIEDARKDVWAKRKTIKGKFKRSGGIRFNKRHFKYASTLRKTPIFRITYAPHKRIALPIRKDGAYRRFESFLSKGWEINSIMLLKDRIIVQVKKEFNTAPTYGRYVLGIDIGSKTLAAITIYDTKKLKTIKQLYFGRDIAERQRKFEIRRSKLRSYADKGSEKAKKYLRRLEEKQRNFVKTRSGQIARQIIALAKEYNAYISIEDLHIRGKRKKYSKESNRKINHIPFAEFRDFLLRDAEEEGITVDIIDPYHTSKWCPRCGAINDGHSSGNYALYKCKTCGLVVNSDRKASLAIALKSASVRIIDFASRFSQHTEVRGAVNHLFRPDDGSLIDAVRLNHSPDGKPLA